MIDNAHGRGHFDVNMTPDEAGGLSISELTNQDYHNLQHSWPAAFSVVTDILAGIHVGQIHRNSSLVSTALYQLVSERGANV
jgi:hypothetical protein